MNEYIKIIQQKIAAVNPEFLMSNSNGRLSEDMITYKSRMLNTILYLSDMSYTDTIVAIMGYAIFIFAEMGVYPDYFFENIMPNYYKRRIKLSEIENSDKYKGNFKDERRARANINIKYKAKTEETINSGINKGYYNNVSKTISQQYQSVVDALENEGIICGVLDNKRAYNIVEKRCGNQISKYSNISDDATGDIAYLIRLLCECFFYFALIGKDPTEFVENFVDKYDYEQELTGCYKLQQEINNKL